MDKKITTLATEMIDYIQSILHITEKEIGELISVSQSTIAKWKQRYKGQQTRPTRAHFGALVQLYRVALQVQLGAILDRHSSKTGLVLNVQHFTHACNRSNSYPADDHVVAYRDLKRAATMTEYDWRVHIRVVPLPPTVDARVYRVPYDCPSRFLILLADSLDAGERKSVLMNEIFSHVANWISDSNEGATYEDSTPDYAH